MSLFYDVFLLFQFIFPKYDSQIGATFNGLSGFKLVVWMITLLHVFCICDRFFVVPVLRMCCNVFLFFFLFLWALLTPGCGIIMCSLCNCRSFLIPVHALSHYLCACSVASCLHPTPIKFEPCQYSAITLLFMIGPDGKWEYTTWH